MAILYSKKERIQNKETCDVCEFKSNVRCGVCGCFLRVVQTIKSVGCPNGKF